MKASVLSLLLVSSLAQAQMPATSNNNQPTNPPPTEIQSQPVTTAAPPAVSGEDFENNPAELAKAACEAHVLLQKTEAALQQEMAAGANADQKKIAGYEALIKSRTKEFRSLANLYKKAGGQAFNPANCQ